MFLLYNIFLIYARGILICETVKIDELREINKAYLWLSSRRVECSLHALASNTCSQATNMLYLSP